MPPISDSHSNRNGKSKHPPSNGQILPPNDLPDSIWDASPRRTTISDLFEGYERRRGDGNGAGSGEGKPAGDEPGLSEEKVTSEAAHVLANINDPRSISVDKFLSEYLEALGDIPGVEQPKGRTEAANAQRLARRYGNQLRYVQEWGKWIVWERDHWKRDTNGTEVQDLATKSAKELWQEIENIKQRGKALLKEMNTFAMKSNSHAGIQAATNLARSKLQVNVARLDTDKFALNCRNGLVDLRDGDMRECRPSDFITKVCPTDYIPEAKCPTWEKFLSQVFRGDTDLIGYLQQLLGYSLTGDVREQVLPILWGEGSNGKSTLINAVMHAIGPDYSGSPPRELFSVSKSERHPTQLMTLQGKRLASASETDAGATLNEALIKHLTGGDAVTARGMYENFTTFTPTHKLFLSTNHKPRVQGTDYAIWRRLRLIEFTERFEGNQVDPELPNKLRAEAPGILAWMVRGCQEWRAGGLKTPACVQIATENYRAKEDLIGVFITEFCERGSGYWVGATDLYKKFKEANEDVEMSQTAFGRELSNRFEKGYTNKPTPKLAIWKGLKIKEGG